MRRILVIDLISDADSNDEDSSDEDSIDNDNNFSDVVIEVLIVHLIEHEFIKLDYGTSQCRNVYRIEKRFRVFWLLLHEQETQGQEKAICLDEDLVFNSGCS